MSIFIEAFDVLQVSTDAAIVSWKFGPTNDDMSQVVVDVLRSYSPVDNFTVVKTVTHPQTYFRDTEINLRDQWRSAYYKLSVKAGAGTVIETEAVNLRSEASNPAREIIRQVCMDLRFSGSPAMVYLKRKGARCPACWDPYLKKNTRSDCLSCFATGYDGGYYTPILTLVNFQPETKTNQPDLTLRQESQTTARMGNFPEVRPSDVIYEMNMGARWRIVNVAPSEMERVLLVQELTLVKLNPGDIEHKLPIPDGLDYVILPHWTRLKKVTTDIGHDRDLDPVEKVNIWR
jgi:hypothetical protein